MVAFSHLHCSGRFDRSPESVTKAAAAWTKLAGLLTFTEFANEARAKALRTPGFTLTHVRGNGYDEYAILSSDALWVVERAYDTVVTDLIQGGGRHTPARCMIAVLRHHTGRRVLVSILHSPRASTDWWDKVNQEAIKGWKRAVLRAERELSPDGVLMVSDLNRNVRRPQVRAFLRAVFPKRVLSWLSRRLPARGTHGRAIIDGALLKRLAVLNGPHLLDHTDFSDHTAFLETVRFL